MTPEEHRVNINASHITSHGASQPATRSFQAPLAPQRLINHQPKAGLNPIVDAAANLFSIIGRLKQLKNFRQLNKLHQELIHEIQAFQNSIKAQSYSSEHILASRYALCATLDDIIQRTAWGSHGQWEQYSLLSAYHPESATSDRFFIILERINKEPALYIEILELMYICISLGFQGPYGNPYSGDNYNYLQFEKIVQNLYQQIRAYRGDFPKSLSPFTFKPTRLPIKIKKNHSLGFSFILTGCFILIAMMGLGYSLGTMVSQINQDLKQIGKTTAYESRV